MGQRGGQRDRFEGFVVAEAFLSDGGDAFADHDAVHRFGVDVQRADFSAARDGQHAVGVEHVGHVAIGALIGGIEVPGRVDQFVVIGIDTEQRLTFVPPAAIEDVCQSCAAVEGVPPNVKTIFVGEADLGEPHAVQEGALTDVCHVRGHDEGARLGGRIRDQIEIVALLLQVQHAVDAVKTCFAVRLNHIGFQRGTVVDGFGAEPADAAGDDDGRKVRAVMDGAGMDAVQHSGQRDGGDVVAAVEGQGGYVDDLFGDDHVRGRAVVAHQHAVVIDQEILVPGRIEVDGRTAGRPHGDVKTGAKVAAHFDALHRRHDRHHDLYVAAVAGDAPQSGALVERVPPEGTDIAGDGDFPQTPATEKGVRRNGIQGIRQTDAPQRCAVLEGIIADVRHPVHGQGAQTGAITECAVPDGGHAGQRRAGQGFALAESAIFNVGHT